MTRAVATLATAVGHRAVVTAAAPIAASIGASVMAGGGTVFDAAVAAALAETVLLPPKCGLAGDVIALVRRSGEAAPTALLSIGPATTELADRARQHALPAVGAWSVGMPGAPAGYAALARYGNWSLPKLVAPAVDLARSGYPWAGVARSLTVQARDLLMEQNPEGVPYLPGGEPVAEGALVTAPGLADVLEAFAERGEFIFDGPVGDAVVKALADRGRPIVRDDLLSAVPEAAEPSRLDIDDLTLWATPSPTYGPWLLDAVGGFRPDDERDVLETVEASVQRRLAALHDDRNSGTSVVGAADHNGNSVIIVHSNSFQQYGSGVVVAPYGLVLSNRAGRGFAAEPGHRNFPSVGRRPATTLNAWSVGTATETITGATPGGENQIRWNAQTLAAIRGGERDPGVLVSTPRWGMVGDQLQVEAGHPLLEHGPRVGDRTVTAVPALHLRSAQQIMVVPRDGSILTAAADPRTGARAVAW